MKASLLIVGMVALAGAVGTAQAADAAAGKAKASACAGCHGQNGEGSGQNPALAGMQQAKFVQALKDYKSGKKANPVMKNFATSLDDKDMENLAAYYASLKKK